jgi:hypothetical protein
MLKHCLAILMLIACLGHKARAGEKRSLAIEVKPLCSGKPLALTTATYLTAKGDTVSIHRLRFYLSAFVLTFENGQKYVEANSYHLVDAEDPSTYKILLQDVPEGKISSIAFNIGVDSAMSVSGAMAGDLDPVKGMYWAWNSGYINAKVEGVCKTNNGKKNHTFEFHIGGYLPHEYALRSVKLHVNKQPGAKALVLVPDLALFLEGLDLRKENSIMIPGKEAMRIADKYQKMFNIEE